MSYIQTWCSDRCIFFFFFRFLKTVFHCVAPCVLELCRSDWPLKRRACLFCLCMHYHHLVFYLLIMMFLLRSGLVEFHWTWTYFVAKGCFVSSASTLVLGTVVHCHTCWRYYFSCLYCSSFCAVEASTVLMCFETGSLPSSALAWASDVDQTDRWEPYSLKQSLKSL